MNSSDADRQIQQMIAFIKQEAKEKAEEIEVKTQSAATAEKLNLTMQMSLKIRGEFERLEKDRSITKKIERSKLVNDARLATMKERDTCMKKLKDLTLEKLEGVSKHKQYPELIKLLIVESCMKMTEKNVYVQCRKEDEKVVTAALPGAKKAYEELLSNACGLKVTINLAMDTKDYLPAGPSKKKKGLSCVGGIVCHANGKKMICRNTIESRLDIAFDQLTPQLRGLLFGFREAPKLD